MGRREGEKEEISNVSNTYKMRHMTVGDSQLWYEASTQRVSWRQPQWMQLPAVALSLQ